MGKGLIERFVALHASSGTRRMYASDLKQFEGFLRERRKSLLGVREPDAAAWKAHLEERTLAPITISRMLTVAKCFYSFLIERLGILLTGEKSNPFRQVRAPRFDSTVGKTPCPTVEEVERLFRVVSPDTPQGIRDRAILTLLFKQGLRLSEVARIRKEHLRKVGKLLSISVPGKGGRQVQTVLPAASAQLMEEHLRRNPSPNEFIFRSFSSESASHLTPRAIRKRLKRYIKQAELDPRTIRCHSGRVYFITQAYLKTRDLERVARAVGHRNIATTRRYLRFQEALTDHPALVLDSEDSDSETARRPHAA